jgi:hypothetical protein
MQLLSHIQGVRGYLDSDSIPGLVGGNQKGRVTKELSARSSPLKADDYTHVRGVGSL